MLMLPWPPSVLNPNCKSHWSQKAKAAKIYHKQCYALANKSNLIAGEGNNKFIVIFYPPDKRKRDDDNMIGAFKHGRDGVAKALGVDDNRFQLVFSVGRVVKGGAVGVSLGPL